MRDDTLDRGGWRLFEAVKFASRAHFVRMRGAEAQGAYGGKGGPSSPRASAADIWTALPVKSKEEGLGPHGGHSGGHPRRSYLPRKRPWPSWGASGNTAALSGGTSVLQRTDH